MIVTDESNIHLGLWSRRKCVLPAWRLPRSLNVEDNAQQLSGVFYNKTVVRSCH